MTFFKSLQNMQFTTWHKVLILFAILMILCSMFCHRGYQSPAMFAKFSAGIGPVHGDIGLEAFDNNARSVVLFFAPWCGACKNFMPTYDQLMQQLPKDGTVVDKLDCEANKDIAQLHNISAFPTIKYLPNGLSNPADSVEYSGDRTLSDLKNWIKQRFSVSTGKY